MNSDVVIVDYGMGNINSIKNMLRYLGYSSEISNEKTIIMSAKKLILPGVGNFGKAMENINNLKIKETLEDAVISLGIPILGICLGMQLLLSYSEEGECEGLDWIEGKVKKFDLGDKGLKVPHMGWDYIKAKEQEPIFDGLTEESRFYFVHSYYVECDKRENSIATTDYGITFDSAVRKGNIYGMQYHPEKSHKYGMQVLGNFMKLGE